MMIYKKVAVVADVMMSFGGAEVVTETIMEMYPSADFYTLFFTPKARKRFEKKFPEARIYVSSWQWFIKSDFPTKYVSVIKLLSWIYWERLNLKKYDLVISSSHSFGSKAVKTEGKHVSYIHTPPRYLYDEYSEISFFKWQIFWPIRQILKYIDRVGATRPDVLVANSKNVAKRIEKYYERKARVAYPPVEVKKVNSYELSVRSKRKEYYVCLSRLVKQKGIDLVVRVCSKNGWKLVVMGNGPELESLKRVANEYIDFVIDADEDKKAKLLSGARALIYTSINEDWGMVPVEAQALGVPVIAYRSGGVVESVVDGKTGMFFDEYSEECLANTVKRFNRLNFDKKMCVKNAKLYSKKVFVKKWKKIVG